MVVRGAGGMIENSACPQVGTDSA